MSKNFLPFRELEFVERFDVRDRTVDELLSLVSGETVRNAPEIAVLSRMTLSEMTGALGIGSQGARKIQAALELGNREISLPKNKMIRCGEDVAEYFRSRLSHQLKESFWLLTLDQKHHPIDCHKISEGTLSMTPAHPREAFSPAVKDAAGAVLYIHNHPSGDPTPSNDDIVLTKRLVECGNLLGIRVLDHVVVAKNGHSSLKHLGYIEDSAWSPSLVAEAMPKDDSLSHKPARFSR